VTRDAQRARVYAAEQFVRTLFDRTAEHGDPVVEFFGTQLTLPPEARFASAEAMAVDAPIRVSDFEVRNGTRYTVDTLEKLMRRFPKHRFIWLMGEDTVAQFHQWKRWRVLARMVPIAVLSRPGYDDDARAARAMGWLRRFVRPACQARNWTEWSVPAINFLRLPPDRTSATRLRALNPDWHRRFSSHRRGPVHP